MAALRLMRWSLDLGRCVLTDVPVERAAWSADLEAGRFVQVPVGGVDWIEVASNEGYRRRVRDGEIGPLVVVGGYARRLGRIERFAELHREIAGDLVLIATHWMDLPGRLGGLVESWVEFREGRRLWVRGHWWREYDGPHEPRRELGRGFRAGREVVAS